MSTYAVISTRPVVVVGGRVFTDLTNLIVLYGLVTASKVSTLRKHNGTAGYQVAASKKFQFWAWEMDSDTQTAGDANSFKIVYADNDAGVNTGSSATFTNPEYPGDHASLGNVYYVTTTFNARSDTPSGSFYFEAPASKYPAIEGASTAVVTLML